MSKSSIEKLVATYQQLVGKGIIDYERFTDMLITHHSTALEGSTLTLGETQTLLEKGLTAGGKPLEHHLMATDHQVAQRFVSQLAEAKTPITIAILQQISQLVMKNTSGPVNTILGNYDTSLGEIRKTSASSTDGRIFLATPKIAAALERLCGEVNQQMPSLTGVLNIYNYSFLAHFALVSIHPFGDGNGRLSRLLMNYVQHYHELPSSLVYTQDRTAYLAALEASRQQDTTEPILLFMNDQLRKFLQEEIDRLSPKRRLKSRRDKGGLTLFF